MGRELYENHSGFRYWMDHCDRIVYPLIETSLIDVLYGDKTAGDSFDDLLFTNPALLSIEYSLFKILEQMDIKPNLLLGYSLGEYTACVVSGAISIRDGLLLVIQMARLLEEKTVQKSMLAIMGSQELMIDEAELFHNCRITGSNLRENFVVCGALDEIQYLQAELSKKEVISQPLAVKYGFHTHYIDPIEIPYKQLIQKIEILPQVTPILSSLKQGVVQRIDSNYLWEVIRYPVNFRQTIYKMLKSGDYIFIDLGPSGTLATFIKYIITPNSSSVPIQTINTFGRDLKALEKMKSTYSNHI